MVKTKSRIHPEIGFTIVELLIVLAIAGLILLIVLQAIPALVRNSRNNQRKQDVSIILEAISHYELNNSGNFPNSSSNFLQYYHLTYYAQSTVSYGATPGAGIGVYGYPDAAHSPVTAPTGAVSADNIEVHNYQKCNSASHGTSTNQGAGYSDVVALYAVESSGGISPQCEQL